jgi:hypothetical protein
MRRPKWRVNSDTAAMCMLEGYPDAPSAEGFATPRSLVLICFHPRRPRLYSSINHVSCVTWPPRTVKPNSPKFSQILPNSPKFSQNQAHRLLA